MEWHSCGRFKSNQRSPDSFGRNPETSRRLCRPARKANARYQSSHRFDSISNYISMYRLKLFSDHWNPAFREIGQSCFREGIKAAVRILASRGPGGPCRRHLPVGSSSAHLSWWHCASYSPITIHKACWIRRRRFVEEFEHLEWFVTWFLPVEIFLTSVSNLSSLLRHLDGNSILTILRYGAGENSPSVASPFSNSGIGMLSSSPAPMRLEFRFADDKWSEPKHETYLNKLVQFLHRK